MILRDRCGGDFVQICFRNEGFFDVILVFATGIGNGDEIALLDLWKERENGGVRIIIPGVVRGMAEEEHLAIFFWRNEARQAEDSLAEAFTDLL